jgi:hypothetical protein
MYRATRRADRRSAAAPAIRSRGRGPAGRRRELGFWEGIWRKSEMGCVEAVYGGVRARCDVATSVPS